MNAHQKIALANHCRLAVEVVRPMFHWVRPDGMTVTLTVNSGYELIEEGYGGPVWHASVCPQGRKVSQRILAYETHGVLRGVGFASLGEWAEYSPDLTAYHLRRRLSPVEEMLIVPPVADIRGTKEAWDRVDRVREELPKHKEMIMCWEEMLRQELGRVSRCAL